MENYSVRYCQLDEVDKLQRFIDLHWKKGHILSTNKALLDFQHKSGDKYNFVVAYNKTTEEFDVILGFIPQSQYDSSIDNRHIWLAIWMKTDQPLPQGLGTKLLDFLEEDYQPETIGSIGINDNIEKLYLKRGWKASILDVWYFLKPCELIRFEESSVSSDQYFVNKFAKSEKYYINRYDKHPFYTYKTYQGIVYRKIETEWGNCLRIVDFKNRFYLDEYQANELLKQEQAGYIDCLNYGMDPMVFDAMGFKKRSDRMIIPQWFEPFDLGVRNIKFAFKSNEDYFIVKGDSDQDRPSIIKN